MTSILISLVHSCDGGMMGKYKSQKLNEYNRSSANGKLRVNMPLQTSFMIFAPFLLLNSSCAIASSMLIPLICEGEQ